MNNDDLQTLYTTILSRKNADAESSYTAKLFAKGRAKIAQKVGEEAVETAIAAAQNDKMGVVSESADLLYHLVVLWAEMGIAPEAVFATLRAREGTSGLTEKAERKNT
jgi:phosphoribosyl-ATP pyrophosphohydrolase